MSDRFSSDVLSIDVDGHVGTLWLDRPDARNALGPAFWTDLPAAMAELSDDDQVRAVVVAARGIPLLGRARPQGDGRLADRRGRLPFVAVAGG